MTTTKSKAIFGSAPSITVNVYNMRDSNGVLCEGSSCATNTDTSVTYAGAAGTINPVGCSGGTCLGITLTMPELSLVDTFPVEVSSNSESATFDFSVFDFDCETYCQDKTSTDVAMILNHVRCLIHCCSCTDSVLFSHLLTAPAAALSLPLTLILLAPACIAFDALILALIVPLQCNHLYTTRELNVCGNRRW